MFIRVGKIGCIGGGGSSVKKSSFYLIIQKTSNYKGEVSQFQLRDKDVKDLQDNTSTNLWVGEENKAFKTEETVLEYIQNNFNQDSSLNNLFVSIKNEKGTELQQVALDDRGFASALIKIPSVVILDIQGPPSFQKEIKVQLNNNNCVFVFIE